MTSPKKARVSILDTKRAGNFKRKMIDGVAHCVDCDSVIDVASKGYRPIRCDKCIKSRKSMELAKQRAHTLVAAEIRHGMIKRPSEYKCVDCGRDADFYDHRDYTKPLDVVPVCRSCNVLRGPATKHLEAA